MADNTQAIKDMMMAKVASIVPQVLPNAKSAGGWWQFGGFDGSPGTNHGVNKNDGSWKAFNGTLYNGRDSGDILSLIQHTQELEDFPAVIAWCKNYLGITDDADFAVMAKKAQAQAKRKNKEHEESKKVKRAAALQLWLKAEKWLHETPVDEYLAGRGVSLLSLNAEPGALRYMEKCYHPFAKKHYPAMVSWMGTANKFLACHHTYLEQNEAGKWVKITGVDCNGDDLKAKLIMGSYKGGMITISKGKTGERMSQAQWGEEVIITEGIEDALTLMLANPDKRVVAAGTLGQFANIILPDEIRKISFLRDNDGQNAQASAAFDKAIEVHQDLERDVFIIQVPPEFKDVNDWLLGNKKDGGACGQ